MKKNTGYLASLAIPTEHGDFLAHYSSEGLAGLEFPRSSSVAARPAYPPPSVTRWHKLAQAAVLAILRGDAVNELPPLDLAHSTEFQREVWGALQRIPQGKVETYANIAAEVGRPKGSRAVGNACGANPIPLLIPCHRVVASNGGLGGFTSGLKWKKTLLAIEGADRGDCQQLLPCGTGEAD